MTKIKLCGLSCLCDIEAVNELRPEYIGFVFVNTSKRYISQEKAKELKKRLTPEIKTVGVFADKHPERDCRDSAEKRAYRYGSASWRGG